MKSTLLPVSFTSSSTIVSSKLSSVLSYIRQHHVNYTKMFTRRNWLLRCSILINVAVILYICSHVMIGGGGNFASGPAYIIQDEGNSNINNNKIRQVVPGFIENTNNNNNNNININNNNNKRDNSATVGGSGGGPSDDTGGKIKDQEYLNSNKEPESNAIVDKLPQNSKLVAAVVPSSDDDNSVVMNLVNNNDDNAVQQSVQQQQVSSQQQQQSPSEQQQPQQQQQSVVQHNPSNTEQSQKETSGDNNDVPTDPNEIAAQEKSQNEIAGQPDTIGYVNNSNTDGYIASGDEKDFDDRLRLILKCHDRDYQPETLQRGDFWVLKNYIRAGHGELKCHETITYTTHADYTFLDNLIPLLERWNSPVSIALHAPGNDFQPTINSIAYLRDCLPESTLVRQFVTFHIYFSTKHIPKNVTKPDQLQEFNCATPPPFVNITSGHLYKTQKKLLYPVNVGRNIARDSAQTHFILASDIELYPNPGLVKKFLEMIARNDAFLQRKYPRVFPLSIFEVESSVPVPKDKTELQELLRINKAIPFHKRVCSSCHGVPKSKEWMAANETEDLGVFHIGKRVGYFVHWEPIYIGTHADPHYDERLSWEGKSDKMTQGYALCVLNYEFHILDNAFLVHKPGIKVLKKDPRRAMLAAKTNQLIRKIIYPELRIMYGTRKGCAV